MTRLGAQPVLLPLITIALLSAFCSITSGGQHDISVEKEQGGFSPGL